MASEHTHNHDPDKGYVVLLGWSLSAVEAAASLPDIDIGGGGSGVDRLITGLYGTTQASREDPGLDVCRERLASMDHTALQAYAGTAGPSWVGA